MSETDTKRILEIEPKTLLAYEQAKSTGFEGTLSDFINEKIIEFFEEHTIEYFCVFKRQECPVRKEYKLQPENLLEYCKICYINPTNEQEPKTDATILSRQAIMFLEMYLRIENNEDKDQFLQAIKLMSEIQTQ